MDQKIKQYCSCAETGAGISLFQKLIDVQQTLITNPNPLKEPFPNPGKTKLKIRYQSTSIFF
jgi:hypothetical protein